MKIITSNNKHYLRNIAHIDNIIYKPSITYLFHSTMVSMPNLALPARHLPLILAMWRKKKALDILIAAITLSKVGKMFARNPMDSRAKVDMLGRANKLSIIQSNLWNSNIQLYSLTSELSRHKLYKIWYEPMMSSFVISQLLISNF